MKLVKQNNLCRNFTQNIIDLIWIQPSLVNTTLIKKKHIINQKKWSSPSKITTIALWQNAHLRLGISSNYPRLVPSTRPPHFLANCLKYVHHLWKNKRPPNPLIIIKLQWLRFSSFHFISRDHHVHQIQNLLRSNGNVYWVCALVPYIGSH